MKAKTILVVDDSTTIRNMLKAHLQPLGHHVLEAAGGRAGLEQVRNHDLDLIITDQNMPGMDGVTMVKAVREGDRNTGVPIIVLTTETSDQMKAAFREAGASGWMSKPYSPDRLDSALKKYFG